MVMTRTTIELPEEVLDRVQSIANERGMTVSEVFTEVLDQVTKSDDDPVRPVPLSFASGASGHRDTARRMGEEPYAPRP